jgi:hypothetical protein
MPFTKDQLDAVTSTLPTLAVWRDTVALVEGQERLLERMRGTMNRLLEQRDAAVARVAGLEAAINRFIESDYEGPAHSSRFSASSRRRRGRERR